MKAFRPYTAGLGSSGALDRDIPIDGRTTINLVVAVIGDGPDAAFGNRLIVPVAGSADRRRSCQQGAGQRSGSRPFNCDHSVSGTSEVLKNSEINVNCLPGLSVQIKGVVGANHNARGVGFGKSRSDRPGHQTGKGHGRGGKG